MDPAHERFAIFDQVAKFLSEASRAKPVLLVLDDLHAADLPSLELLHFVSRTLRARRIAIIGTLRSRRVRRSRISRLPSTAFPCPRSCFGQRARWTTRSSSSAL
jgi:hypothetical protein